MPNRNSAWPAPGTILGYDAKGRAIRFIGGGSEDAPPENPSAEPAAEPNTPPATDEALGEGGKKALQEERKAKRELERQLAEISKKLTEYEQRDMSELDRLKAASTQLEQQLVTERATRLKLEIAAEHEITGDDLVLLTASDEETLRAQAARIQAKNEAAGNKPPSPLPGQGTPPAAPATATVAAGAALYQQQKQKI